MAWVRFPDGTRRKVERVAKSDALADLDQLLATRDEGLEAAPSRARTVTFDEVFDAWFEAGCPNVSPTRKSRHARDKSPNTIASARQVLGTNVRPVIGGRRVDRTSVEDLEAVFQRMADRGYATSTITHAWNYLNQACQHALRNRTISRNVAPDVLLPKVVPSKKRKSLTREQAEKMVFEVIPESTRPAMWLTGLMSGLRPGELAGLRWPFVDLDSEPPTLTVMERAARVGDKYVGQAVPKTEGSKRRLDLHPLNAAALLQHRDEQKLLGLYDVEGLVFPTKNGTPMSPKNMRRALRKMCADAGFGDDWTTYELRHSCMSLLADELSDMVKVSEVAGHADTRTSDIYRHPVRDSVPHAAAAWDRLLSRQTGLDGASTAYFSSQV
jgi:integrase